MNKTTLLSRLRPLLLLVLVLALVAVVLVGGRWAMSGMGQSVSTAPVFEVAQGPLTISINESGTITSRDLVRLRSEVRGRNSIIFLIAEGTSVQEGDLLVELDSNQFQEQVVEQQIRVENAEASMIRASENLEVVRSQGESDVSRSELDFLFAGEDLRKYVDGEYPKQLREFESRITLAREEHEQALNTLEWSHRLHERRFISDSEFERDQLMTRRKELDYELRVAELDLLRQYTYTRQLAKLESDVVQMKMALERVERRSRANLIQAEADLRARRSELDRQRERLHDILDQISKCRIYAPSDGMAVYASTGNRWHRGDPLREGSEVQERQELIHLPRSSAMMAELQIHESALERVHVGMPARITVDALPGQVFIGQVGRIGLLPDPSQWWNPDNTVYSCEVYLHGDLTMLRTGMSCQVEILVDHFDRTLFVPVQAVMRHRGQTSVWVEQENGFEPRPIRIGMDNARMVHVLEGLDAGERIHLAPPMAQAALTSMVAEPEQDDASGQAGEESAPRHTGPTTLDTWSQEMVEQSREVARLRQAQAKAVGELSEEDREMMQTLAAARDRDELDALKLDSETREQVDAMLKRMDAGESLRMRPQVRRAVTAALRAQREPAPAVEGAAGDTTTTTPRRGRRSDAAG